MRLSVIIPIYNVEQTLDRCIESVLRQCIDGMEVILVDDGSPDNCPQMCDEWALSDSRIRVIHKKNGGQSSARNAGLDIATGEYITFVDSDDYLNDDIYRQMFKLLGDNNDADIIEFSINCIGWQKIDIHYTDHVYTDAMEYWRKTRAWNHSYLWNKIFKKDIFKSLRFHAGALYEDLLAQPSIIVQCNTVVTSSIIGYNYCMNSTGSTAMPDSENLKQALAAEQYVAKQMNAHWYREWHLFMCMMYRQVDIYRMSGEIILRWPFVRFVCWVHKMIRY